MSAGKAIAAITMTAALALCGAFTRLPAPSADPRLKEVKAIYDAMYSRLPQEGKVYHFSYRIVSTLSATDKAGRHIVNQSDIDLFSSKDQYRFISKDISVYQDKQHKFTVLPAQKVIYWGDSDMGLVKGNRLDRLRKIQDTIFYYAEVVDCKTPQAGEDKVLKVKLQKKLAEFMQINQVTYHLDAKGQVLKGLRIDYPASRDVIALDFTFHEPDYDYKKMPLTSVRPLFVTGRGLLTAAYASYKLIDVRKKTNFK